MMLQIAQKKMLQVVLVGRRDKIGQHQRQEACDPFQVCSEA
jgi:hypothetical protein